MKKNLPVIDTNLLLLFVIGSVDHGRCIHDSKRLGAYKFQDFELLSSCITSAGGIATTPYILAETSNLIDLTESSKVEAYSVLKFITNEFEVIDVEPKKDTSHKFFVNLGLADANLLDIALYRPFISNDNRLCEIAYKLCPSDNIIPWYLLKQRINDYPF